MTKFQASEFSGNANHPICCTGDCVVGDHVAFERATFTGSLSRPRFAGFEMIVGEIVAESYGAEKQQHTFTLKLGNGTKIMIKGRNLYANGTFRAPWENEAMRKDVLAEKHRRGDAARHQRTLRREGHYAGI